MSTRSYYEGLARRILRCLRGSRTQVEMSRLLGIASNQWHRWESGQRVMKWEEFHSVLRKLAIPIDEVMDMIVNWGDQDCSSGKALFMELRVKFASLSVPELARNLSISPQKIHRIQGGTQRVELWLILMMLGKLSRLLPFFIERVAPGVEHSGARGEIRRYGAQRRLEAEYPWLCVLEALIEHRDYKALKRHRDEFFSEKTGMPVETVRRSLKLLRANSAILWRRNKFHLNLKRVDMEHADLGDSAALARFWTGQCLARFGTPDGVPSSRRGWTYRIFPVSASAREKIRNEIQRFYGRLHHLIASDEMTPKDGAQVLLLHFYDVAELQRVGAFRRL